MGDIDQPSTIDLASLLPAAFKLPPGICNYEGCTELASADYDEVCHICYRTMCPVHIGAYIDGHNCPLYGYGPQSDTAKDAYALVRSRISQYWVELGKQEILPAAAVLRPGVKCTIDTPTVDTANKEQYRKGGCNIHFPVTFADGVQWLARVHYSESFTSGDASRRIRTSEVAALQTASALVPNIIPSIHIASTQNVHDLPFFFIELADGLGSRDWPRPTRYGVRTRRRNRWYGNLVKDFARYMTKMSAKTFTGVGTLTFDPQTKEIVVGPLIQPFIHLLHPDQHRVYATSAEFYIAQLDHLLHLVRERLLGWDIREGFLWLAEHRDPIWLYVNLLEARELVGGCEEMNIPQPTYLRHTDDHPGQFFATAEGRISALIDWEYSATLPFAHAFTSPRMFYEPLLKGIKIHNFDGSRDNALNRLETKLQHELIALGRPDLAEAVGGTRKYQRLEEIMRGEPMSYENLAGMRLAFNPHARVPASKEAWIAEAKLRFAADEGFQVVIAAYEEVQEEERKEANRIAAANALNKAAEEGWRKRVWRRFRSLLEKLHLRTPVSPTPSRRASTAEP